MGTTFPHLSAPLQIAGVTLRNRMITTSMSPGAGYTARPARPP